MTRPVVYVVNRYPVLTQTFVRREIEGLEAAGQPVTVVELRHQSRWPALVGAHVLLAVRHPWRWLRAVRRAVRLRAGRAFLAAGAVARRVDAVDARHVHAHFAGHTARVAGAAAALSGRRFTVTGHGVDLFRRRNAEGLVRSLDGVAAVVSVSEFADRYVRDRVPGVRSVVVRNAVAVEPEVSVPRADGPVLCVARLVPKKGVDTLVRALPSLRDLIDLRVEVLGEGRMLGSLGELARALGVDDRFELRGAVPYAEVEEAIGRASMVVLPCRIDADGDRDNLPTVLVEALAHAVPVISTPVGGIPELVEHERTGLLVPSDDREALASAIRRLWEDPLFGATLGADGRAVVAERFAPSDSTDRLRYLFTESG